MSDDTKRAAEIEADEMLQRLERQIASATPAPEPGAGGGAMIEKTLDLGGGEHVPIGLRVADRVESAGYTWVYDRETGEAKQINNNMLRQQLKKMRRLRDGSLTEVFTTLKPPDDKMPKRGTIKCLLHADHPEGEQWAKYGFPRCYKENLVSEYDLEQHMQVRHQREWKSILRDRERVKEAEARDERRALIALASRMSAPAAAPTRRGKLAGDDQETAA